MLKMLLKGYEKVEMLKIKIELIWPGEYNKDGPRQEQIAFIPRLKAWAFPLAYCKYCVAIKVIDIFCNDMTQKFEVVV